MRQPNIIVGRSAFGLHYEVGHRDGNGEPPMVAPLPGKAGGPRDAWFKYHTEEVRELA